MRIIALTGAGISKAAGIPTYQEMEGLKAKMSVEFKEQHPKEFEEALKLHREIMADKEPTKAHKALADLQIPIITTNIDGLHLKAGSKIVYQLHGHYKHDIVLYGQDILHREDAINLIIKTATEAKRDGEDACLLVIGTSLQTAFAYVLVWLATERGMSVHYINDNADEEVPKFLKENVFLAK